MKYYILSALAVWSALALGCSSSSQLGGNKVSGKVTYNGNPVSGARVTFTDGSATGTTTGSTAVTDESGQYALVGVPPGTYKVVVYKLVTKPGVVVPEDMDLEQLEAAGVGSHALPRKYATAASTTLTAVVDSGSNEVDLKLEGK